MSRKRHSEQQLSQAAQPAQPTQYELLRGYLASGDFCGACEPPARLVMLAVESTGNPASQEGSAEILNENVMSGRCNLARNTGMDSGQMIIGDLLYQAF